MSIQGSLQSISIMELFSSLLQWSKTGVLTILTESEERGFLFFKGNLVYATSRDSARRLGAFLVRLGYLTAEELKESMVKSPSGQGQFGQRLIESGKITQRQLRAAVKAQLFDIFLEVFAWDRGAFVFDDQELPFAVSDDVLNSTQTLLLEAATRVDENAFSKKFWKDSSTGGIYAGVGAARPPPAGSAHGGGGNGGEADAGGLPRATVRLEETVPDELRTTVAPNVPSKIFAISGKGGAGDTRICDVLSHEPMVVAKVLKVLSIGNMELDRTELAIPRIVERLGSFNVRCLLLPEAVRGLWFPDNQFFWRECWEHDQICAHLCDLLAERTSYPYPGEAYIAGLLHNLGVYILLTRDPAAYRLVAANSFAAQDDVETLERAAFGVSHTRIGELYARKWNFPPAIQLAIKDHHRVGRKLSRPLLHMVAVASSLAHEYGYRVGFHPAEEDEMQQSLEALGVPENELISLFIQARHRATADPEEVEAPVAG